MTESKIQLIGFGRRIFPANYFSVREVGTDYVLEFIFDDGTKDPGLSLIGLTTDSGIENIIQRADELLAQMKKDNNIPKQKNIISLWKGKKPLNLDQAPFRVSHFSFAGMNDIVTLSFAFVHPNVVLNIKNEVSGVPFQVPVQAEVSLEFNNFLKWLEKIKKLKKEIN